MIVYGQFHNSLNIWYVLKFVIKVKLSVRVTMRACWKTLADKQTKVPTI